jgi:subtilase family serine protease
LSKIIVFEAGPSANPNDVLNRMASSNQVKQLSCPWGWGGGPSITTDNIFKQMAAQGQSFFSASGDSDAFTTGANSVNGVDNSSLVNAPSSSPYITMVGGTTLSTSGPEGAWASEKV